MLLLYKIDNIFKLVQSKNHENKKIIILCLAHLQYKLRMALNAS